VSVAMETGLPGAVAPIPVRLAARAATSFSRRS
jgi:hypothetical protein